MEKFRFLDLFSGIGGFHQAMKNLGGECVLSSEIDVYAIDTYEKNYNIKSSGNIQKIDTDDIPEHDVLCAGFLVRPFQKQENRKDSRTRLKELYSLKL